MSQKKLVVSHAPFWHIGSAVPARNYNIIIAAIPAVLMGMVIFGVPALAVLSMSVASAIIWELLVAKASKRPNTVGDANAALIGLLFAMLLPASVPWWLVVTGTFLAIVIGKQIFGGIGANPFNPAVLSYAILSLAWRSYFDFDAQYVHFEIDYTPFYPLLAAKAFGTSAVENIPLLDLFVGKQLGGLGSTSGLALTLGGIYLIARGLVRWEIPLAFIAGLFVTAGLFHLAAPETYAGPLFHLLTGFSLIGAFFLATEDSSSPVNLIPMLIYGAVGGVMTMLIRNIGAYPEGVIYALLLINLMNPLIDKIRPKAIGKVA
ncbi:MAG: RnfABCDGE type electron transport complex subunit D [Desulfobacteraceae bacterium]|nr:MAG: RnfABCDGE type electron transport complex subunit D [Desulfobacteraceae bacterium]